MGRTRLNYSGTILNTNPIVLHLDDKHDSTDLVLKDNDENNNEISIKDMVSLK